MATKPPELDELLLPDVASWRDWLAANHARRDGVRLVLSKRGILQKRIPEILERRNQFFLSNTKVMVLFAMCYASILGNLIV